MGNGKGLGQGQYHILNIRARERSAGSSGKLGAAGTQCSIGNLDPTPSASLNGLRHLTDPGACGTHAAQRTGILGCINSAHSSHLLALDLVLGWKSLSSRLALKWTWTGDSTRLQGPWEKFRD